MWSLLNGYTNYIKIGLYVMAACGIFYSGFHIGNQRYLDYKSKVEISQKTQEQKVESITKQQELVTKGIKYEYDAKLSAVRNYYKSTSMWNNNGSSTVPGISPAPSITDVISSYNELAERCAETTVQVIELQKWINEQVGIK